MPSASHPREDEFYVGYLPRAPGRIAHSVRLRVALVAFALVLAAWLLAGAHALRPQARFEYGAPVELAGTLARHPYPHLAVPRPGGGPASLYTLVAPFKHGADAWVAPFDGQAVRLAATLAYRDGTVVAELVPGSIQTVGQGATPPSEESLGTKTLVGEIVDSKCFFGVMNPGELKPHRGCAVRCIAGGIPPVFCVRDEAGRASYFWLLSERGEPVNKEVLDTVAEPLEIRGEVRRRGEQLVLWADPATYRRLP